MFGYFTYPATVSSKLMQRGWSPQTLPSAMDLAFGKVVRTMRSNGVSVDDAVSWLDGALQGDENSILKVDQKSGVYGMMLFGTRELREAGKVRFWKK